MDRSLTRWREKILLFKCAKEHEHSLETCGLKEFKENLNNETFNNHWRKNMKIRANKSLPDLDRCEGGMGGDRNTLDRQLRYPVNFLDNSNSVKIHLKNPSNFNSNDLWMEVEIKDLISSFISTARDLGVDVYCLYKNVKYF